MPKSKLTQMLDNMFAPRWLDNPPPPPVRATMTSAKAPASDAITADMIRRILDEKRIAPLDSPARGTSPTGRIIDYWVDELDKITPYTDIEMERRRAEELTRQQQIAAERRERERIARMNTAKARTLEKVGQALSYVRAMQDMGVTGYHGEMWNELERLYKESIGEFDECTESSSPPA